MLTNSRIKILHIANKKQMSIQKACFSGKLTVVDKNLFIKAVTTGIGRSKTYGCGLLQVVPLID